MPGAVYRPFQPGDLLHTVVSAHPLASFVSGTGGWSGSLGVSSSLSLYEGVRARRDVSSGRVTAGGLEVYPLDPLDTHSIDRVVFVSGSYPSTGSLSYVTARDVPVPVSVDPFFHPHLMSEEDWYEEHFRPVLLLYDYYSQYGAGYFTGSYDYYCLNFLQSVPHTGTAVVFSGAALPTVSSSYTVEARVRPLSLTGSADLTVMSQAGRWRLFVSGSGVLCFDDGSAVLTSSAAPVLARWQHVAFTSDGATARFHSGGVPANSFPHTGSLSASSASLVVGALSGTGYDSSFRGFVYETRVWSAARTDVQLSASSVTTLVGSGSATLVHYARFNDGPLGSAHGLVRGSGVFDHSPSALHGMMVNFGTTLPLTPTWHKNDDLAFSPLKTRVDASAGVFRVVHVPSMFYGRQLVTGSVRLTCKAYDRQGIVRVLRDDGRGSLYVSGSVAEPLSGEEGPGVRWNKVGNVFYSEGLVVITEPSLLDFGSVLHDAVSSGTLGVQFRGVSLVPSKVFMCRLGPAQGNASNNPTYASLDDRGTDDAADDRFTLNQDEATTYVTAVGVYNERHELVAVAKLAQPVRKRERDRLNFRLKFDF